MRTTASPGIVGLLSNRLIQGLGKRTIACIAFSRALQLLSRLNR
jgi:hypothetical protein